MESKRNWRPSPQSKTSDADYLNFIKSYWEANLRSPKYLEIQKGLGVSNISVVHYRLKRLVEKGKLICSDSTARSYRLPNMRVVFDEEVA